MFRLLWIVIFLPLGLLLTQNHEKVRISSIDLGDLKVAGFSLHEERYINIDAEGAGEEKRSKKIRGRMFDPTHMLAYAWILDAKNREMVWRMNLDNTNKARRSRFNRTYSGRIKLPAGDYELYFSAIPPSYGFMDDGFFSLGRLFEKLFGNEDEYQNHSKNWFIEINGIDEAFDAPSMEKYHNALKAQAIVSITDLTNSDFRQEGFRLRERGKFQVYSIGEALEDENFDYGWIIDASKSEKVWESLIDESEYAGGVEKNRMWNAIITLDPGDYWIYFVMDDSHSPDQWNSNPPYDPNFYGITVTGVEDEFNPQSIEKLLKVEVKPIVEITRVREDQYISEGFKINETMRLRIHALGEGRRGEMYDYGWITDAKTGETVWEMDFSRTRDGGGTRKNRLIDEIVTFRRGSYIVHYRSDDSHNYNDWNASKPYNPNSWGITIYPADPKYKGEVIEKLDESLMESDIIAQIVRVGSGNHIQKRFNLIDETRIRIYGIGEGDRDEMYDYGWIESEGDGQPVWEMTHRKTRWAGGAKKNRKVEQTILLDSGSYILHYKTDDSHDYSDWNDDEPDDPVHYGITLYKAEKK